MVAGTLLNVLGLGLLAAATSPLFLVLAYLVVQASNNVAGAAYAGVIPDVVPAQQRGVASGMLGTMNGIGTVAGVGAVYVVLSVLGSTRAGAVAGYACVAVILVISLLVTVRAAHEARTDHLPAAKRVGTVARGAWRPKLREFFAAFRDHDFFWTFATRALMQMGIFSIVPFMTLYFSDVVDAGRSGSHNAGAESALWLLAVLAAGIAPALIGGHLSDKWKRRKRFVYIAGALQVSAASVLLFSLIASPMALYGLGLVFGVGYGMYYAVDWALACDVLPDADRAAGRDMALWHIALTLPQVLAPAILASVLHTLNESGHHFLGVTSGNNMGFRVVFGSAAVWFALGTVMVHRIRKVA
jgi:MFS family permease